MQREPEIEAGEADTLFAAGTGPLAPVNGQAEVKPPVKHQPPADPQAVADKVVAILAEHRKAQEPPLEPDPFRWNPGNEAIVVPEQQALAVYENEWSQTVIRQERAWDQEEDTFIVISKNNLPTLIARLQSFLPNASSRGGK